MTDEPTFERVHSVTDYYDGPRIGVADFRDRPHLFVSTHQDLDVEPDVFLLWPINADELALVLESWALWRRWQVAFHAGQTTLDTHPTLPPDRARYDELKAELSERGLHPLCTDAEPDRTETAIRATAEFEASGEDNGHASLLVRWSPIDLT